MLVQRTEVRASAYSHVLSHWSILGLVKLRYTYVVIFKKIFALLIFVFLSVLYKK